MRATLFLVACVTILGIARTLGVERGSPSKENDKNSTQGDQERLITPSSSGSQGEGTPVPTPRERPTPTPDKDDPNLKQK